jgi:hypothetical protein
MKVCTESGIAAIKCLVCASVVYVTLVHLSPCLSQGPVKTLRQKPRSTGMD